MPAAIDPPLYSLSVVSHGQAQLVRQLLADLDQLRPLNFEVLVTANIAEDESAYTARNFPLSVTRNPQPLGFGANHNAAFARSQGQLFVVVNPDIRAPKLDLNLLANAFDDPDIGACAPLVLNSRGSVEDSARRFPTVIKLVRRVLFSKDGPDYSWTDGPCTVDWVAGMFIVFRREAFAQASGFDARRYFMYYEDVDLCERLGKLGWAVRLHPGTSVIHDAQRASHGNLQHMRWHLTSALRYLTGI